MAHIVSGENAKEDLRMLAPSAYFPRLGCFTQKLATEKAWNGRGAFVGSRWPLDWPDEAAFTHRWCQAERTRWNLHLHHVARRAGVAPHALKAWEEGKLGRWGVRDELWRRQVWRALRLMVVERARAVISLLDGDTIIADDQVPQSAGPADPALDIPSFLRGPAT
jgi:hypothetical protein